MEERERKKGRETVKRWGEIKGEREREGGRKRASRLVK